MKTLINRIRGYFYVTQRIRKWNRSARSCNVKNILHHIVCRNIEHPDVLQVTNISIKENKTKMVVTVSLGRPGLLIGRHGSIIDQIEKDMSDFFHKEVKISIKETIIW